MEVVFGLRIVLLEVVLDIIYYFGDNVHGNFDCPKGVVAT